MEHHGGKRRRFFGWAYLFEASFAPIALEANTPYWFSIVNSGAQGTFRWTEASSGLRTALSANGVAWTPFSEDGQTPPNFTLYDDTAAAAIPEPSTVLLIGAGVVGLVCRRQRDRRVSRS